MRPAFHAQHHRTTPSRFRRRNGTSASSASPPSFVPPARHRARRGLRSLARLLAVGITAPLAFVALPGGVANAATPEATFAKASDWGSGFTGQYTIRNQGSTTLTTWRVEFDLPAGTTVGSYWDALQTGSTGGHYVFTNREYNGTLAPGAAASFGFLGAGSAAPTNCKLNGNPCTGPAQPDTTAPTVPSNLRLSGASSSSLTLAWNASTDNDRVSGYDVFVDGAAATTVTGTNATVSGLAAARSYTVKVRAKDPTGNLSAFTADLAASTTPGGPDNPPPGSVRSVPYIDITRESPTLTEVAAATGHKVFTLAFVLGSNSGCDPQWGGTIPLAEPRIVNQINALRAQGGDVVVATGGAAGPYLEASCGSVDALAGAYLKIIDTLGVKHLDIDIEASIPVDTMNKALARVQRDRPGTTVSFTLMIQGDDYGLTPILGVDLLKNARDNGVSVDIVNAMTMEFGTSRPVWGDAVIAASEATLRQMKEIWPAKSDAELKRMLAVTPMIGRNFNGKIFTQSDAGKLVTWANTNHIGRLGFWSVGRDNGSCPGGGVSPSCSSIAQSPYEFTTLFKNFTG
ncbi:cellulose binding domain-containing protein [Streptomyces sp. SID3343]|uniref:cellulose binding domain-containing protein n=1 Tax=Streptomyces sp. SID3343 TaxID=2690260 RepID=UPI00136F9EA6|nr:cellulose binding domain-containing protein [Streptomyces sp. SID3343]MYW03839.1 carbohydrate-binding protein [Streptomyces sp. SID3343]